MSCLTIIALREQLFHTGKKGRHIHVLLSTAQNDMISDIRLCEAVRQLPAADLRQQHQLGGWIKYLAF